MTFEELGLEPKLLKAVTELGFQNPTPIQEQTIAQLQNKSTDIVALAQTGTGKTAGFGLPLLSKLDLNTRATQALILAPTRELCVQISKDLVNYSKYLSNLKVTAVYGGAPIMGQIRDLKAGSQVVVATPGRLCDLIDRRAIDLSYVDIVVLDEADEMLNMGFKDDLDIILGQTPPTKNTWLFSATMPQEVERIARKYMENPLEISVGKKNQGAANIQHVYYMVNQRDRYAALKRIADFYPEIFGIVFCRTKAETQEVADNLIKDGYNADALHGDLSQSQRDFVMKRFRSRTLQMLVATDVAARGIDVNDVTHVINYNLPEEAENYTHRSGRTARAGKSGISIAIVTPKESGKIRDIERIIQSKFTKANVPNGVDVCEKQLFNLVTKLHDVEVKDNEIEKYLPKIYEELKDLSKEELIKRFVSEEFNRFYNYYQNAPDLNSANGEGNGGRTARFFVNMGAMDGFNRMSLKDFLAEIANVQPRMVFNVDVKNSFSFFETEPRFTDQFLAASRAEVEFNGRPVSMELSNKKAEGGKGERKSFGGGERKSFGGERKSYGGGERKSYGGGERKSYGGGEKRSYGKGRGESKSFGGNRESSGGARRERFSKDKKGY
ncbi:MAG: DEAD/DEAH box helicase [Bacteroidetes bacterium]|nr:DEAD/DEAH box helicase [Bacteroidota bacterium]